VLLCNLAVLLDVIGSSGFLVFAILELAIALKGYIGFRRYPTSRSAGIIELFGGKKNPYKRQRPLLAYLFYIHINHSNHNMVATKRKVVCFSGKSHVKPLFLIPVDKDRRA
jgi:hypothetical protein